MRAAKRAATERNSDIFEKILFLPEKDDSVIPFYKIFNEIHYDTALYRQKDNKDFCFLSDYGIQVDNRTKLSVGKSSARMTGQLHWYSKCL